MQTVHHVGAGLIQGGGEDARIGGQGRTDLHEGTAPLGAPERGSGLPVPTGESACTVGNARREPGPVALTVSPPSNLRASHRAATIRPWVELAARAQVGLCRARARRTASSTMCWATSANLRCSAWLIARSWVNASSALRPLRPRIRPIA